MGKTINFGHVGGKIFGAVTLVLRVIGIVTPLLGP